MINIFYIKVQVWTTKQCLYKYQVKSSNWLAFWFGGQGNSAGQASSPIVWIFLFNIVTILVGGSIHTHHWTRYWCLAFTGHLLLLNITGQAQYQCIYQQLIRTKIMCVVLKSNPVFSLFEKQNKYCCIESHYLTRPSSWRSAVSAVMLPDVRSFWGSAYVCRTHWCHPALTWSVDFSCGSASCATCSAVVGAKFYMVLSNEVIV